MQDAKTHRSNGWMTNTLVAVSSLVADRSRLPYARDVLSEHRLRGSEPCKNPKNSGKSALISMI